MGLNFKGKLSKYPVVTAQSCYKVVIKSRRVPTHMEFGYVDMEFGATLYKRRRKQSILFGKYYKVGFVQSNYWEYDYWVRNLVEFATHSVKIYEERRQQIHKEEQALQKSVNDFLEWDGFTKTDYERGDHSGSIR